VHLKKIFFLFWAYYFKTCLICNWQSRRYDENYNGLISFSVRETPRINTQCNRARKNDIFFSRGKFRGCSTMSTLYLTTLVICRFRSSPRGGRLYDVLKLHQSKFRRSGITRCAQAVRCLAYFSSRKTKFRDTAILSSCARDRLPHECRRVRAERTILLGNLKFCCILIWK